MSSARKLFLLLVLPLLVILGALAYYLINTDRQFRSSANDQKVPTETRDKCTPFELIAPVDLTRVTSILYPGQERGGHYKPHGGFRFDSSKNEDITVIVPFDASVTQASRYIEQGEVQYLFEFVTDCGYTYRFDHLKTLSPQFQELASLLPEAKVDDSRTTQINAGTNNDVKAGDIIATAVGFEKGPEGTPNVSVDFGVYYKTARNIASQNQTWAALHEAEKELTWYGVCWFDLLPANDSATVKALPASADNSQSDYCK